MLLPREFVGYMARKLLKRLTAQGLIQFEQPEYVTEVITQVMLDEVSVEDRLNDEVRKILEEYQDEMQRNGASYEEMYKKVKRQLVRERKLIL